jgi:hypothetical protein
LGKVKRKKAAVFSLASLRGRRGVGERRAVLITTRPGRSIEMPLPRSFFVGGSKSVYARSFYRSAALALAKRED